MKYTLYDLHRSIVDLRRQARQFLRLRCGISRRVPNMEKNPDSRRQDPTFLRGRHSYSRPFAASPQRPLAIRAGSLLLRCNLEIETAVRFRIAELISPLLPH